MSERWTIEELDNGRKYMIQRENRRCVAVVSHLAESEVIGDDVLLMFANSNRMLAVCRKLTWARDQDVQAAIAAAASIINDIEIGRD